jgi:hypothetical protein
MLTDERSTSAQLRAWAEKTENLLTAEKQISEGLRAWAERTETLLAAEREVVPRLQEQITLLEARIRHYDEMTFILRVKDLIRYCLGKRNTK